MPYIGTSPSQGVRRVHTYTATASQTTFTGAGAEGATLSYKDSNFVDVYQNGIKLGDADYTSTSGTSIVLAQGASVDDIVVVVVFDVFSVADTVSKADGGQFDGNVTMAGTITVTGNADLNGNLDVDGTTNLDVVDIDGAVDMASTLYVTGAITSSAGASITTDGNTAQLTLTSTDADASRGAMLDLARNSASPADNDLCGTIRGLAKNDAGQDVVLSEIIFRNEDVTDGTEDGQIIINCIRAGSQTGVMKMASTETVMNYDQVDLDFRVASDNNANMLFVDGGNDIVGIGITPVRKLHVGGTGSGQGELHLTNDTTGHTSGDGSTFTTSGSDLLILQRENANTRFYTNGTERMRIDSNGNLNIGRTSVLSSSFVAIEFNGTTHNGIVLKTTRTTQTGSNYLYFTNSSETNTGKIQQSGTTSVNYITTSDYRLKENVTADWDATTRLKQLNPVRFNFIADGADRVVDGFLAHEVQSVVPEAISGTHNEVDDDGNPVYQGIDQSKLVPLLVKTIQELEARITALENAE